MNYEDQEIDEYHEQLNKKHSEMVGWGFLFVVVIIALSIVILVAQAIKGWLN